MFAHIVHSQTEMSVSTAPAYNQQICIFVAQYFELGDVVCNFVHFGLTKVNHFIVIFRFGRDCTCFVTLFKTTDTMHEALCSRDSPIAYTSFFVTLVRSPVSCHIRSYIRWIDSRIFIQVRKFPGCRAVGYKSISQQYNRSHVFQSDFSCHICSIKTVGR